MRISADAGRRVTEVQIYTRGQRGAFKVLSTISKSILRQMGSQLRSLRPEHRGSLLAGPSPGKRRAEEELEGAI